MVVDHLAARLANDIEPLRLDRTDELHEVVVRSGRKPFGALVRRVRRHGTSRRDARRLRVDRGLRLTSERDGVLVGDVLGEVIRGKLLGLRVGCLDHDKGVIANRSRRQRSDLVCFGAGREDLQHSTHPCLLSSGPRWSNVATPGLTQRTA